VKITLKTIMAEWLQEHGYDGLAFDDDEGEGIICACYKDELFVEELCGEVCRPAYKITCDDKCDDEDVVDADYYHKHWQFEKPAWR